MCPPPPTTTDQPAAPVGPGPPEPVHLDLGRCPDRQDHGEPRRPSPSAPPLPTGSRPRAAARAEHALTTPSLYRLPPPLDRALAEPRRRHLLCVPSFILLILAPLTCAKQALTQAPFPPPSVAAPAQTSTSCRRARPTSRRRRTRPTSTSRRPLPVRPHHSPSSFPLLSLARSAGSDPH